jgi:cellobiose phosphorylase
MTVEGCKNNVVENERFIYVRDDDTGRYFAVGWLPVARPYSKYLAIAEPGCQWITNVTDDIRAEWRIFVPAGDDPVEIWHLKLADRSGRPRRLSVFTYVSMKCDGYDLYSGEMFRLARYVPEQQAIFVRMDAEQHEKIDFPWHNGFMTGSLPPESWDADPGPFIGGGGRTLRDPQAVETGRCTGSVAPMWPSAAALHWRLDVPASGETQLRILLGACDGEPTIDRLRRKYLVGWTTEYDHLRDVCESNNALVAPVRIDAAPELSLAGMLNVWVKLQCHYGLYWGRWGFCGYRDQLQQVVGNLSQAPDLCRERILAACRHQYADGFALRGWRPIDTHRNVDSASWLIHAVTEYVKETADFALLDEVAPFYDSGEAPVRDHLVRALDRLWADRGAHGLPLSFEGDWNDSLTGPCRRGKGESVWMGMAFCRAAALLRELALKLKNQPLADQLAARQRAMADAVNAHGWDGGWYLCALDDDGEPIGSAKNDEGRIFLNTQSWAHLGGVADDERWTKSWAAAREQLDTGWGFMLNTPAYTRVHPNVGRLSYIRPGAGENASVYTHGNAFLFLALLERGLADEALEVWRGINPANPARPGAAMPNVFYNGFYGPDSEIMPGLADHAWTTGSCAWMLHGVVELMFGLRRTYDGLVIRPCIPSTWPTARITRVYRGTTYRVTIDNPHAISGAAVESIAIDGTPHAHAAPLPIDAGTHEVTVTLDDKTSGILYDWRPQF